MTLILSNAEIAEIVSMKECIDVLEEAYFELAQGRGASRRRSDIVSPSQHESGGIYGLKSMDGVSPNLGVGAIRINSEIRTYPEINGFRRIVKVPAANGRYTGLVLLFSTTTGEPLAILPDGEMQPMRVAATSALAAKYLAREDARIVAILGSGWQARSQVRAIGEVRKIDEIRCFSTRAESRENFAREMSAVIGVPIKSVTSTAVAVAGADIVLAATNSYVPVLKAEQIEKGMHLGTITTGEFGPDIFSHVDLTATLAPDSDPILIATAGVSVPDGADGSAKKPAVARVPGVTLLDLISDRRTPGNGAGQNRGRTSPQQTTCFNSPVGLGFQFAAVGAIIYRNAMKLGRGREVPTEWFTQLETP